MTRIEEERAARARKCPDCGHPGPMPGDQAARAGCGYVVGDPTARPMTLCGCTGAHHTTLVSGRECDSCGERFESITATICRSCWYSAAMSDAGDVRAELIAAVRERGETRPIEVWQTGGMTMCTAVIIGEPAGDRQAPYAFIEGGDDSPEQGEYQGLVGVYIEADDGDEDYATIVLPDTPPGPVDLYRFKTTASYADWLAVVLPHIGRIAADLLLRDGSLAGRLLTDEEGTVIAKVTDTSTSEPRRG